MLHSKGEFTSPRRPLWHASLITMLTGCGLIAPTAPDAGRANDGGLLADDGGATLSHDAGPSADSDGGRAACGGDLGCAASQYCSRETQRCRARCSADGCIGPTFAASNNRIVSDGEQLCYADDDGVDGGNGYALRSWDGRSRTATTLAKGGADLRVVLVADGYCYYAAPSLARVSLTGGPSEPLQALEKAPRRAWLSDEFVWWSAPHGDQLQIYRLARDGDAASELVAMVPADKLWEAGNDSYLFRRFKPTFASCAVVMAPIDDLSAETTIPMSFSKNCSGALWASDESIVFTQFEPVHYYPFRVDLANLGVETTLRLHSQELMMYQVRGSYIYAQSVVDGSSVVGIPNTVSYQRAGIDGSPTERLFTPTPGTAVYSVEPFEIDDNVQRTFAVLDGRVVYEQRSEARLIAAPLLTDAADAGL